MFDYCYSLINKAVVLGCDLMVEDSRHEQKTTGPENIPQIGIFRHFIDIIDSIGLLVKAGSSDTPKIFLRAALESLLYIEYIFKEKTLQRSLAYMASEIHNEIAALERHQRIINDTLRNNGYKGDLPFSEQEYIDAIDKKKQLLKSSEYHDIEALFEAKKQEKKSKIRWYQLDTNAHNIERLANSLEYKDTYEIFYRKWSGGVHGSDLYIGRMFPENNNTTQIVPIRHPEDIYIITEHALQLCLKACTIFLQGRLPDLIEKYKSQIAQMKINLEEVYNINISNLDYQIKRS